MPRGAPWQSYAGFPPRWKVPGFLQDASQIARHSLNRESHDFPLPVGRRAGINEFLAELQSRDTKGNGTVFLDQFVQALDKYDTQLDEDELIALVQVI